MINLKPLFLLKGARLGWTSLALFLSLQVPAKADFGANEPVMYAGGFPMADTLRKKELLLYPPPWGWVAYGVTDRLTLGWDYPAGLFGFPGFISRYKFADLDTSMYSLEFYVFGIPKEHYDDRQEGFRVRHGKGWQGWAHINRSAMIGDRWRLNLYGGVNYKKEQDYLPHNGTTFAPVYYRNHVNPDAGADLEWHIRPWVRMHVNYSYGNTFYFFDQIAMKSLIVWSFHFAPWTEHRWAIVRNLRFDLSAMWTHVPDAHYKKSLSVPIFPTVYWQW